MTSRAPAPERVAARLGRRLALIERIPDDEFLVEVRAYLCDALPVDLLYRAAAALAGERERDTSRLRRLLERALKDLRAAKGVLSATLTRHALQDAWYAEKLEEFDNVSRGRVALPQESVEQLQALLSRIADKALREHRASVESAFGKWIVRDYREAVQGWRFSEDYDEAMAEAARVTRVRRMRPWGALQRIVSALRLGDPDLDRAVGPGAPVPERRLRTFIKLFADPKDTARLDPSADALKPVASSRDEAQRDLLRVHNYLLEQLERSAAADEVLAAYRRRLRLAGAAASLPRGILAGEPEASEASGTSRDPADALAQDLLRFLFDAGFVPVTAASLGLLADAEPLAGSADVLPIAIVTAPRADADAEHPVFARARGDVAAVMRKTGTVGGYVVALNGEGFAVPGFLECPEGTIRVVRI
ncbi:MAG TPA: hypothetical protein VMV18_01460 [bacterium]|nr:hypothetical protein [bacterium]